jgi:hypothetical protein
VRAGVARSCAPARGRLPSLTWLADIGPRRQAERAGAALVALAPPQLPPAGHLHQVLGLVLVENGLVLAALEPGRRLVCHRAGVALTSSS